MGPIPEEIVEKTWQEVAGFTPNKAHKEMMRVGNNQPELLAFLMEVTEGMDQEVRELAIYIFFVVYRMFQKIRGRIKRISPEEIIECYGHSVSMMERLEGAHEKFLDRVASVQVSRQPYVVKYVVDALMEENEGNDAAGLTEEQKAILFILLTVMIDVLDQRGMKL
jgi:hypothetical protein